MPEARPRNLYEAARALAEHKWCFWAIRSGGTTRTVWSPSVEHVRKMFSVGGWAIVPLTRQEMAALIDDMKEMTP